MKALTLLLIPVGVAASPGNFDARPYLAEAHGRTESTQVVLQKMQGTCPAGAKRAVMWSKKLPVVWLGCWARKGENVYISWEDGDASTVPANALEWVKADAEL